MEQEMKIYETKKREERDDNDERPTPEFREASGTLKSPHNALKIFDWEVLWYLNYCC